MKAKNSKRLSKLEEQLETTLQDLQEIYDDEQETYDSRSDKWKDSEKGEQALGAIDLLEEAINCVEVAHGNIGSAH